MLDRNGLRPSRYYITKDDQLILSSEVGVLEIPEDQILVKERLHPGKMLLVDTLQGKVISDDELKETYAKRQPYGEWLDSNLVELKKPGRSRTFRCRSTAGPRGQDSRKAFGYSYEEYRTSIRNMALNGSEGIASMGVDTRWPCCPINISRCSTISNSCLHR